MPKSKLEVLKLLVVSTAHLPAADFDAVMMEAGSSLRGEYGTMVWLPSEGLPVAWGIEDETAPEYAGIVRVFRAARSRGCAYVLFDRNAEVLDGAPTYAWAEA